MKTCDIFRIFVPTHDEKLNMTEMWRANESPYNQLTSSHSQFWNKFNSYEEK